MKMYRIITIFVAVLLSFSLLSSCSRDIADNGDQETLIAPYIPESIETDMSADLEFDDYECMYSAGRDRGWEQDIIYLAQMYLGEQPAKGHPYLIKEDVQVIDTDQNTSMRCFYDEEIRTQFIEEIRSLILQIPELSDIGIVYELQRIVALLNDGHAYVSLNDKEYFPFAVEPLLADGNIELYVVRMPSQYEHLLYSKLISINDTPTDEIIGRLSDYVSSENEHWNISAITNVLRNGLIMKKAALQAACIMDREADTAIFTFLGSDGICHEIELEALKVREEYFSIEFVAKEHSQVWEFSYSQYHITDYWFVYISDINVLYLRLYNIPSKKNTDFEDFIKQVTQQFEMNDGTRRVIIDFRDNTGGNFELIEPLLKTLAATDQLYILINESCFSASVAAIYTLKTSSEDVVVIGAPTGQSPNFFGNTSTYELKSHNVSFTIPNIYWEMDQDYTYDALMPDMVIYPSLDDYLLGIDTVLEAAFDLIN